MSTEINRNLEPVIELPNSKVKIGAEVIQLSDYVSLFVASPNPNMDLVVRDVVNMLKKSADEAYGDLFNKQVCEQLDEILDRRLSQKDTPQTVTEDLRRGEAERLSDELGLGRTNINLLELSEWLLLSQIRGTISEDIIEKYREQEKLKTASQLAQEAYRYAAKYMQRKGLSQNPATVSEFATLWIVLNTSQPYPFKESASRQSVLLQMAKSFFEDDDFILGTFICMSYTHEKDSRPGTVRVTPGPIESVEGRDNDDIEAIQKYYTTVETFKYFLGAKVKPYAILSDVDFVDVFRVTDKEALEGANSYLEKYNLLCQEYGLIPLSLLEMLNRDTGIRGAYEAAKDDILQNVNRATTKTDWVKNPDFYYDEIYINKLAQSIFDYYNSLPGVTMTWEVAYQNTLDKLLVYGAQPEILRGIFPDNFVFVSSESPVRDAMYIPRDKALKKERLTIIYPFEFKEKL